MSGIVFKNAAIYTENEIIENGFLVMEDGKITDIGSMDRFGDPHGELEEITLEKGAKILPGFIDVHIHGAGGADTMDGTPDAIKTMAVTLPKEGTTSFLATTMTQSEEAIIAALRNAADYIDSAGHEAEAEVLGIHLEGPFINPDKKGAQPEEHIIDPSIEVFEKWQKEAKQHIRLVTVAPEMENGLEFIKHLSKNSVTASIGHTDSTYEDVKAAVEAGATQVTHLFNGMRSMHHREPGTAGAALLFDELKVELISDGIHVRPEMIDLAVRAKGSDGALLITDAMRAKCLKSGRYELGGQPVNVADGKATLDDGTLAGSILKMIDSVKNMLQFTGLSLAEISKLASGNPAKQIGMYDRKGSIAVGKDADLVILSPELDIEWTICRGHVAYKAGQ